MQQSSPSWSELSDDVRDVCWCGIWGDVEDANRVSHFLDENITEIIIFNMIQLF